MILKFFKTLFNKQIIKYDEIYLKENWMNNDA